MIEVFATRLMIVGLLISAVFFGLHAPVKTATPEPEESARLSAVLVDKINDKINRKIPDDITERLFPKLQGEFVALSDGHTHYTWFTPDTNGKNGARPARSETIVFIHSLSLSSFIFEANAKALADEGYRVLTYDLFGRGYSDRPKLNYGIEVFTRQLNELLAALDVNGPVHLVGYSIGATIAAAAAQDHPEQYASITMISPTAAGPLHNELTSDILHIIKDPVFGPAATTVLGDFVLNVLANDQFKDAPARQDLKQAFKRQLHSDGYLASVVSTAKHFPITNGAEKYYSALGKLDMPVLAIWGEGDNFAPFDNITSLKRAIPRLFVRTHPTADHNLPFAHPEFVNASLILHFAQLTWAD